MTAKSSLSIYLSYARAYGTTFEDFAEHAAAGGFAGVQLIPDQRPNLYSDFDASRIQSLRQRLAALGLGCTIHNVFYDINLASVVPAVCEASFQITERVLDLAVQLDARSVTVHPGYFFPGWRRDSIQAARFWEAADQAMAHLGQMAQERRISVLLENGSYCLTTPTGHGRTPLHLGIQPTELLRLVHAGSPTLFVSLDLNKAIHSGEPVADFLTTLGPYVRELQLSTIREHEATIESALRSLSMNQFPGLVVLEGQPLDPEGERQVLLDLERRC